MIIDYLVIVTQGPPTRPKTQINVEEILAHMTQTVSSSAIKQHPSNLDSKVPCLSLQHRACVVVLEVETHVLALQIVFDIELDVFLQ